MDSIRLSFGINIDMYNTINTISEQCNQKYEETLIELINIGLMAHTFEELIKIDHIQKQYNNIIVSCHVDKLLNDTFEQITLKAIQNNQLPTSINMPFTQITKSKIINHCIHLAITIPMADCIM